MRPPGRQEEPPETLALLTPELLALPGTNLPPCPLLYVPLAATSL
jgi:hypothetical protein